MDNIVTDKDHDLFQNKNWRQRKGWRQFHLFSLFSLLSSEDRNCLDENLAALVSTRAPNIFEMWASFSC